MNQTYHLIIKITVIIIFFTIQCFPQKVSKNLHFKHLTKENGLSSSVVLDIIQLDNGKMMIGNWGGLNIFDSNINVQVPAGNQEKNKMSNDRIYGFTKDKKGNIWFGTESLVQYNQKTNTYTSHFITYIKSKAYQDYLIPFYVDDCGLIWLFAGKHQKPITFNPETSSFDTTGVKLGDYTKNVVQRNSLYQTVDTIWSYSQNESGIKRSYYSNGIRKVETLFNGKNGYPDLTTVSKVSYYRNLIWIACHEGLVVYNFKNNTWKIFNQFEKKIIRDFRTMDFIKDMIWVGTFQDGLLLFDLTRNSFSRQWKHDPSNNGSISSDKIENLKIDSSGNLWISALFSGLDWCNIYSPGFTNIPIKDAANNFTNVSMTRDHSGLIWYATNQNGVRAIDLNNNKIVISLNGTNSPLKNYEINDLYCDKNNIIWICTNGGLFYFDNKQKRLVQLSNPEKKNRYFYCHELEGKGLYCLHQKEMVRLLNNGKYWTEEVVSIIHPPRKVEFSYNCYIVPIPDHEIILSTEDSVSIYKFSDPKTLLFSKPIDFPFGHALGNVFHKDGIPYFCFRKKLARYQISNNKLEEILLPLNEINNASFSTMVMDSSGHLWVGTKSGLWWISADGRFKKFTDHDGLISNEFIENSGLLDITGNIVLGTAKGFIRFNPAEFTFKTPQVRLVLEKFEVNYKPYSAQASLENLQNISLPYNENSIAFSLSVIDFQKSSDHLIEYQLEGYENKAIQVENPTTIRFPNLPHGQYRLKLRVLNRNFEVLSPDYSFAFQIHPPWYQSWWFILLVAGITLYLSWFLIRQRTRRLLQLQRSEIEKEQLILNERSRIARDMHDDLGSGLSAIHLLSNFLKNEKLDENSYKQIEKIASSSTELNQKLREIIWSMNPGHDYVQSLADFIRRYLTDIQELNPAFQIQLNLPDGLPDINLDKSRQKEIYLCIKEAVNNALKHSGGNLIKVTLQIARNNIIASVQDNGHGLDLSSSTERGGNGLNNLRHRMNKIGGTLEFVNEKGCRVIFNYPLQGLSENSGTEQFI